MNTRQLAENWFEAVWARRNPDAIAELMDKDAHVLAEGTEIHGASEFRTALYEPFVQAFPDIVVEVDGITADESEAAIRWTVVGTHLGDFGDIPPSGKAVRLSGMSWARFEDGRIVSADNTYNLHGLIEYLAGRLPALPARPSLRELA